MVSSQNAPACLLAWKANAPYWDARTCAVVRGRMLAWLITGECPYLGCPVMHVVVQLDTRLPGECPTQGMPGAARGAARRYPAGHVVVPLGQMPAQGLQRACSKPTWMPHRDAR